MSISTFLELAHLTQMIALALSIFNLVAFLWLACTVWLNGDRHSMIARVGVVGLSLSALFFFIHALLISSPPVSTSGIVTPDALWHLIWLPALGGPYIWFVVGLHYAALINDKWRRRRPLLLVIGALLGGAVLLLLIWNQSTFTFVATLRLLAYGDVPGNDMSRNIFAPLVLIPFLFLCYVTFCAIGPWFTPIRLWRLLRALWSISRSRELRELRRQRELRQQLSDAFWNDPPRTGQLDEPIFSWHLARSGLLLAALLMVGLTISLGVLGVRAMVNWLGLRPHANASVAPSPVLNVIPLNLMVLDILAVGLIAFVILLLGYAIVRHGILIERPLARRGFFEQWRGIVIVATLVALFIALLVDVTRSSLGGMLLITALATGTYALFTWSSYTAHDRYIGLLRPFLQRTNLHHWLNTDLQKTQQHMEDIFLHLCKNVLDVRCGRLIVLNGPVKRSFHYRWPDFDEQNAENGDVVPLLKETIPGEKKLPRVLASYSARATQLGARRLRMIAHGMPMVCWMLPIYDELGLVANLYLGPRRDGGIFTDEDMSLAFACGQRILDTLRDHEAMLTVAGLLRRRIVDVKLLGGQQRRILHDEILPQMHLALLRLETARAPLKGEQSEDEALDDAISGISDAHRRLASMMRAMATSAPHRLERSGMMRAMHAMITHDFHQAFDEIHWEVSEETVQRIDEIVPPAIAELVFAAAQEALRNAARHGRGNDIHRRLHVTIQANCDPHMEIIVSDDGVGVLSASSSTTGTGGGLITHSSLLAIAGGSLTVKSAHGEGATVRIFLPAETLR